MSLHTQSRYAGPAQAKAPKGPTLERGPIRLVPISGSEWRVSNSTIPFGEVGSVLGFAERVDETSFEVLRLGHGHGVSWMTARSLEDVLDYFTAPA
ncbi:MAG: hypothetical protein ABI310_02175 [Microbacteriaceae bacterium]